MKNTFLQIKIAYQKNKELLLYLFFGICTTGINTLCYWLFYDLIAFNNVVSTILSWFLAVIFAFITNKIFVFDKKSNEHLFKELTSFFAYRFFTGILDVVIMAIAVDLMNWNPLLWKLISNIIVTIINYITSKFLVFKNNQ